MLLGLTREKRRRKKSLGDGFLVTHKTVFKSQRLFKFKNEDATKHKSSNTNDECKLII